VLIPREHGAYGQLGFPVLTALAVGRPSLAAVSLTAGFVAAFLAHEPLLVLAGLRGSRARRELGRAALRDGAWMSGVAVVGVAAGAALTPAPVWSVFVPIALGVGTPILVLRHLEKTTAGEMFVALTLTACAVPIAASAGVALAGAAAIWLVMASGYWAATAAVRGSIARQRREPQAALRAVGGALAIAGPAAAFAMARSSGLTPSLWLAALPLSALSLTLAVAAPTARHLRAIGWALVAASAAASVALTVLIRA
jgi:YwiC-like protein